MSIQYKFFHIPCSDPAESEEQLNAFLRSHRVVTVRRECIADRGNSFWCFAVEYIHGVRPGSQQRTGGKGKSRVDYKEVLSVEDFAVFAASRDWRKQAAAETGVPVYTIFTNEQLAKIVTTRVSSQKALRSIDGIGESRIEKYGESIIRFMRKLTAPHSQTE